MKWINYHCLNKFIHSNRLNLMHILYIIYHISINVTIPQNIENGEVDEYLQQCIIKSRETDS